MAKKKAAKKAAPVVLAFVLDFDVKWMEEHPEHPDFKKVMNEARKKKYI